MIPNAPDGNLKQGPVTLLTNKNARILKSHGVMAFGPCLEKEGQ